MTKIPNFEFCYEDPEELPDNYYSRIAADANLPVFLSEGGWPSKWIRGLNDGPLSTNGVKQAEYITRQMELLNEANAIGMFSLTFTDIDLTALPPNVDPVIKYFADLGVVDTNLNPKPAFNTWKEIFKYHFTGQ